MVFVTSNSKGSSPFLNPPPITTLSETVPLILIDFQPSLIDGTRSIDRRVLLNNVAALTKAAKMFDLPIILSTIGVNAGYQGDTIEELRKLLPDVATIDRKAVNAWEEEAFRSAVERYPQKVCKQSGGVPSV